MSNEVVDTATIAITLASILAAIFTFLLQKHYDLLKDIASVETDYSNLLERIIRLTKSKTSYSKSVIVTDFLNNRKRLSVLKKRNSNLSYQIGVTFAITIGAIIVAIIGITSVNLDDSGLKNIGVYLLIIVISYTIFLISILYFMEDRMEK